VVATAPAATRAILVPVARPPGPQSPKRKGPAAAGPGATEASAILVDAALAAATGWRADR
jgi:hypothetical protein